MIILVIAGLILAGFYIIYYQQKKKYIERISENEALFVIDFGKGRERWFKGKVINGMTFFDILKVAAKAGNFNYQVNSQVRTIDDISNTSQKEWQCYINDQKIQNLNQEI